MLYKSLHNSIRHLSLLSKRNLTYKYNFHQAAQHSLRVPKIDHDVKFDFKDVLIRPSLTDLSSRKEVSLTRKFRFKHHETTWEGIPIMAANMDTTGTFEIAEVLGAEGLITCLHKHYTVEEMVNWGNKVGGAVLNNVAVTAGVSDFDFGKVKEVVDALPAVKFLCLDVANGYQSSFIERVTHYRNHFPNHIILAGNVVTPEISTILLQAGADIIKHGIGGGSVCTTRKQTGVGYP